MSKQSLTNAKIKEVIATPELQQALKAVVSIPESGYIKGLDTKYNYSKDEQGNTVRGEITKQVITLLCGESLLDAEQIEVEYLGDPLPTDKENLVQLLNQKIYLLKADVALKANMAKSAGKTSFTGYSAVGFKINVEQISFTEPEKQPRQ